MKFSGLVTLGNVVNRAARALAALCLALMMCTVLYTVGTRTITGSGVPWANEATTYLLVWGVSLGAAYAFWDRTHLAVDFILEKLKKSRIVLELAIFALVYGFLAIFAYYGWQMAMNSMNMTSPTLRLQLGYVYLAIPVCAALAIINITLVILTRKPPPALTEDLEEEIQEAVEAAVEADDLPADIAQRVSGTDGAQKPEDPGDADSRENQNGRGKNT